ncbi:hypothetical protein PsAD2_01451 [Pseudovibrio axinellae]|uniref:Uncharacterized protein n=1 Tax=Pseudovibrio axinellae TaxID=989403 RepID=A0A165ZYR6_9HYPH|nr:hypothetical protein PsAD2_01451 [Pseudovibrio axinellae]SER77888.1 hypothetical protein SAMN05421798_12230 [Pseudovibrio axinellae]
MTINNQEGTLPSLSLERCQEIWLNLNPDERAVIMSKVEESKKQSLDKYLCACLEYIRAHPDITVLHA